MEANHQIRDDDFNDDDPVGFLFVGKTGAGKTTLINSFVNHFFDKKFSDEKLILIPQSREQKCSFPEYEKEVDAREFQEDNLGESKTRNVKSYVLSHNDKKMLIIDTPGVGDTDGFKQDNKNIENIIQGIQKHPFLQAIILVVPLEFREDFVFKYYLDEIRKILTKPCTTQCIVVSTGNYGEVEPHLQDSIRRALEFAPPEDQWFAIENIWLKQAPKDQDEAEVFEDYWEESKTNFQQIYDKASSQFQKIMTKEFQELFDKRINLEIQMAKLTESLESHKNLYIRHKKREKNGTSLLIDIQQLMREEKETLRTSPSPNINYNCLKCHRTCIQNVSRLLYIFTTIITFSISHWIAETNICKRENDKDHHCPHEGSHHKFEKVFRSVGLRQEEIEKLSQIAKKQHYSKDTTSIDLGELLAACKIVIRELVDQITKLSVEIEELGITKPGENPTNLSARSLLSGFSTNNVSFISRAQFSPIRTNESIRIPSPSRSNLVPDRLSTLSRISFDFIQIDHDQAKYCDQNHELQLKLVDPSSLLKCKKCPHILDPMGYRCLPCNYNICDECFLKNN